MLGSRSVVRGQGSGEGDMGEGWIGSWQMKDGVREAHEWTGNVIVEC